ncbi:ABC transporter permease [uncultured Robinsoniella sp.]|uniref:ABC transporter permease n=1 Tax=Robinsoniella sp. TaxID=2496533 RepID=UPI00374E684B
MSPLPKKKKEQSALSRRALWKSIKSNRMLLFMMIPGVVYFVVFCYGPMYGVVLAFKEFRITDGILGSPWAGFQYFEQAFKDPYFWKTVFNTLIISFAKLIVGFPAPIIFAILINELIHPRFKKVVQTFAYLPHFMSWVILGGIFFSLLSINGPINSILEFFGMEKVMFMGSKEHFRGILVLSEVWKSFGWGSVLYFAAIAGIDQEMYEASKMDGANKIQNIVYIILPAIFPVICINLILSLSGILNGGFDQVFNLYSDSVYEVADIIDTYVYRLGLKNMQYSLSTAIGLFKSVIGLIMIVLVNFIVKKVGGKENALW